jgi:hypothetical protein
MIADADKQYDSLIQGSEEWKDKQTEIQNEQHALTLEQINQQKEQAKKDYTKEQSGAYVDWQKQSGKHGANAEAMAMQGMTNTGYSESSQVSMYNAYQNRVATAREAYGRAVLNYDNAIKEATLQNNSVLAQIAYEAFIEQTQLALDGLQYKNSIIQNKFDNEMTIKSFYSGEYQKVLDQINKDKGLTIPDIAPVVKPGTNTTTVVKPGTNTTTTAKTVKPNSNPIDPTVAVNKADDGGENIYYDGAKNPDGDEFGVFPNGYQPRGVSGHGYLSDSGHTVELKLKDKNGNLRTSVQPIWRAEDYTTWYWNATQNEYIQIDIDGPKQSGSAGAGPGGKTVVHRKD